MRVGGDGVGGFIIRLCFDIRPQLQFTSPMDDHGHQLAKLRLAPDSNRCKIISWTSTLWQNIEMILKVQIKCAFFFFFLSFHFSPQALGIEREDTPCRSLTNPKKLSFPSECLIQSRRTTWTGTDGLTPSSCDMIKVMSSLFYFPLCMVQIE